MSHFWIESFCILTLWKMKFEGGIVLKCHVHSFSFVYSIILSMINSSSSSFHLTGKQTKIKHLCLAYEELSVRISPVLRDINFEQSLTCFPNSTCSAEGLSRNVFVAFQATKKWNSIGMFAPPFLVWVARCAHNLAWGCRCYTCTRRCWYITGHAERRLV